MLHGDVLTVETWDPRSYGLAEVKAGDGDDSAQRERIEGAISLLNDGTRPATADRPALEIVRSPISYRSHVREASLALAQARERSYAPVQLEDGLTIQVYDETNPARLSREDFERGESAFQDQLAWESADCIVYSTAARRLRDRTHSFSSLAPLPLMPYSVEDTTGLVMGRYDIVSTLNATVVELWFSERGIEAEVARGEAVLNSFLEARRGTATLTVPATVREQVSVELLTISALVELVDWVLSEMERRGAGEPQMIVDYADEPRFWSAYQQ